MKVHVAGGGPGGLYVAVQLKLADPGHEVVVHERNPEGVTHGWGVGSTELLYPLRDADPVLCARVEAASYRWRGQVVDHPDRPVVWPEGSGHSIGRHRLIELLTERAREVGVEVRFGDEVVVDDLTALEGVDLVVAADGIAGASREAHAHELGTAAVVGRNHYAWLGTTHEFEPFTFAFVRSPAGWLAAHAYAYAPGRSTFIVECPPGTWRGLGLDTLGGAATLRLLEGLFARPLQGGTLLLQERDGDTVPWLHHRAVTNERWHLPAGSAAPVALLGDAAHTTHFSIGSGTRLALDDAVALAAALGGHATLDAALAGYESSRRAAIELFQRDARLSARWLEEIDRYADLDAERFARLFHWRRSRFLVRVPPKPYHRLRSGIEDSRLLRDGWRRWQRWGRAQYVRRRAR